MIRVESFALDIAMSSATLRREGQYLVQDLGAHHTERMGPDEYMLKTPNLLFFPLFLVSVNQSRILCSA